MTSLKGYLSLEVEEGEQQVSGTARGRELWEQEAASPKSHIRKNSASPRSGQRASWPESADKGTSKWSLWLLERQPGLQWPS